MKIGNIVIGGNVHGTQIITSSGATIITGSVSNVTIANGEVLVDGKTISAMAGHLKATRQRSEHIVLPYIPQALYIESDVASVEIGAGSGEHAVARFEATALGTDEDEAQSHASRICCQITPGPTPNSLKLSLATHGAPIQGGLLRVESPVALPVFINTTSGNVRASNMRSVEVTASRSEVLVSNIQESLRIDVGAGGIIASEVGTTASLNTGAGNIRVENITGFLVAETGSGNITSRNVGGGELRTGAGNVEAGQYRGRLSVRTGAGNIHYAANEVLADATLATMTGNIAAQIGVNADVAVEARTDMGHISGPSWMLNRGHVAAGKMGNGTHRVTLKASMGTVTVMNV